MLPIFLKLYVHQILQFLIKKSIYYFYPSANRGTGTVVIIDLIPMQNMLRGLRRSQRLWFYYIWYLQVMIAYKLDGKLSRLGWGEVFVPLHVSLFGLILGSFGSKGGNKCKFTHIAPYLNMEGRSLFEMKS